MTMTIMMMMCKSITLLLCGLLHTSAAFSNLSIQARRQRPAAFARRNTQSINDAAVVLFMATNTVGVFFGTSTGSTESVADLIVAGFGSNVADGPIEIDSIQGKVADHFAKYDALIVGTPTWNTGADTERSGTGWDEIYYGEMQDLKLAGKKVAVFGLGDSVSYAENYADASGELHDVFESLGCKMMGYTSQEGYEHEDSKAIRGDLFCGLLCDEVNQDDLTPGRVENWVQQLKSEGILEGAGSDTAAPMVVDAEVVEPIVPAAAVAASPATPTIAATQQSIQELEQENARLRKLLEENSRVLDETILVNGSTHNTSGYTPHVNQKTGRTMWISQDGRSCYYTTKPPTMSLSP